MWFARNTLIYENRVITSAEVIYQSNQNSLNYQLPIKPGIYTRNNNQNKHEDEKHNNSKNQKNITSSINAGNKKKAFLPR